jgi:hypothetical protein
MRVSKLWLVPAVAVIGAGLAGAPAMAQSSTTTTTTIRTTAPSAPPPLRVETIPPAPSASEYWQPGHWAWNGDWSWISGHYVERPQNMSAWVPGHWDQQASSYTWVDGHWQ